jgi:uncharacterized cofD-like protein
MDNAVKFSKLNIVCLGGGIGTVNCLKGLKNFTSHLTAVVSTADDGGSAGRLRRLYNIFPPGDAISCLAALLPPKMEKYAALLTYRFPGNRYSRDSSLAGHKLGNLLFVAAYNITGSTFAAIEFLEKLFDISGKILPASLENISLSAETVDHIRVEREENIDRGNYKGKRALDRIFLTPSNPEVSEEVNQSISQADVVIAGPGDLYTTVLPVIAIPKITKALISTKAKRFFVINVANKPFETKNYAVSDYIRAVEKHLGTFPFDCVVVNTNKQASIPSKYKYHYVPLQESFRQASHSYDIVTADLLDINFPLYHDPLKLAKTILMHL